MTRAVRDLREGGGAMWRFIERVLAAVGSVFTVIGAIAAVIAVLPDWVKNGTFLEAAQVRLANAVAPSGYRVTTSDIPRPVSGAATSRPCQDSDPNDITMSDVATPYFMQHDVIGLEGCFPVGGLFVCKLAITRRQNGDYTYFYNGPLPWAGSMASTLFDTDKVEHLQLRGYFLNGKCDRVPKITLSKDQHAWFLQEFSGPVEGVVPEKVVINSSRISENGFHVSLKVNNVAIDH